MLGRAEATHPRDRPRRRRRRSAPRARCRSRRRSSRSPRCELGRPVQVGRGPARELAGRAAGARACARRSSSRSTPTAGSSRCAAACSPTSAPTCCRARAIPPHTTAMLLAGCYDIPAVEVIVTGARTNKVPTAPYRGAGRPEATLPDRDGDRRRRPRSSGIDPVELRRRNLVRAFPLPDRARLDLRLGRLRALPGPRARADRGAPRRPRRERADRAVGRAGALAPERDVLAAPASRCRRALRRPVRVRRGDARRGRSCVRSARSPAGQGHETLFAQIAADRLGVDADARDGAHGRHRRARRRRRLVRQPLDRDGRLGRRRGGRRPARPAGPGRARFASDQVFASGAYVAVVEVERATGACGCAGSSRSTTPGRIINPLLAEGQVIGGAVQGLGACLTEEVTGRPSLLDYSLLTAAEIPRVRDRVRRVAVAAEPARREGRSARAARSARRRRSPTRSRTRSAATSTRRSPPRRSGGRCDDPRAPLDGPGSLTPAASRGRRRRTGTRARGGRRRHRTPRSSASPARGPRRPRDGDDHRDARGGRARHRACTSSTEAHRRSPTRQSIHVAGRRRSPPRSPRGRASRG